MGQWVGVSYCIIRRRGQSSAQELDRQNGTGTQCEVKELDPCDSQQSSVSVIALFKEVDGEHTL